MWCCCEQSIKMCGYWCAVLAVLWISDVSANPKPAKICFRKDFAFGVATAAYQVEGAWNASGKGESIWDRYTHEHPDWVFDHHNADIATDSYHKFREDVKLIGDLGVSYYRFSMSWPRILPTGLSNQINEDGLRYYRELIAELHSKDVQALVTMYHWDLPQSLQDLGGWTNPIMAEYFVDYARVLFRYFGEHVRAWVTFNEPLSFCQEGYGGQDAPGRRASGVEDYMCAHTVLRAHGMVYRMYKEEFDRNNQGYIGIALDMPWMEPYTTSSVDKVAAETARQFLFGWFANPIFSKRGGYPPIMRRRIDVISKRQGFFRSRLPVFTKDEVDMIRGSFDFLGLNHYTTNLVKPGDGRITAKPSFYNDMGVKLIVSPEWPKSNSSWLRIVPWGLRKTLNWIKNTYDNPSVVITENGVSFDKGLKDRKRINYIDSYLRSVHAAIYKDNCDVIAYTYWTLMDNFEWMRGFSERFGLYETNYTSPGLKRIPRLSASYFERLARTGCLDDRISSGRYGDLGTHV